MRIRRVLPGRTRMRLGKQHTWWGWDWGWKRPSVFWQAEAPDPAQEPPELTQPAREISFQVSPRPRRSGESNSLGFLLLVARLPGKRKIVSLQKGDFSRLKPELPNVLPASVAAFVFEYSIPKRAHFRFSEAQASRFVHQTCGFVGSVGCAEANANAVACRA